MLQVRSYAGFRYPERPRSFRWEGQEYTVKKTLSEWRTPEAHHFRVLCVDDARFELRYVFQDDTWQLIAMLPEKA